MRYHLTPLRITILNKSTSSVGNHVVKGNPSAPLVGRQIDSVTLENSVEVSEKIKNGTALCPVMSLLGIYPKKSKPLIWKNICALLFILALFTIANLWKQLNCI